MILPKRHIVGKHQGKRLLSHGVTAVQAIRRSGHNRTTRYAASATREAGYVVQQDDMVTTFMKLPP